jgi:UDP-N-acetylglucosamine 2-epimerase (non-hydrolysing)
MPHPAAMDAPIVHIVGARPNFMKAAPVIRALSVRGPHQRLIHTGQHYDAALSDIFFGELGLPEPDRNLGIGSGSHATQTAAMMVGLEPLLIEYDPALVVVYGDVNSTTAAALVAAKLCIPVAHVEAGLRSFDDTMPEEVNRRVTDLLSDLLFVTAPEGLINLRAAGVAADRIHFVGNPMIDTLLANLDRLDPAGPKARLGLPGRYAVATIHRPSNVDSPRAARRIVEMLAGLAGIVDVVLPLHPRGRHALEEAGLIATSRLRVIEPLGYLDFIALVRGSTLVVTDSGGIQEETTILRIPCLTVRRNTERPITVTQGTNRLVEPEGVVPAAGSILEGEWTNPPDLPPLWDGHAGERIADVVIAWGVQTATARRGARLPAAGGRPS